ncbi:MAG TPA: ATP-binding protein [bacterium]|nr:ATP-binding protein [bacterium]
MTFAGICNIIHYMNENHSGRELIYRKRLIGNRVKSALIDFPVVIITGARQVGKSTFLEREFPDFKYINLDDFSFLEQAKRDPYSLWVDTDRVIIDEVQKVPELLSMVKISVDRTKREIRFILSGSSNLLLMRGISETLAGRAVYFEMYPMTYGEMIGDLSGKERFISLLKGEKLINQNVEKLDYIPVMFNGFMPPIIHIQETDNIILWWESYIKTYMERDLRELSQIDSLIDFRKVMNSIALRTGSIINQTEIAREVGISQPTVHRYIKLLETSNMLKRVQSYFSNRLKRVIKSPKFFFIDPALSIYLSSYFDKDTLREARELGGFFENMIYLHLLVYSQLLTPKTDIYYWRTTAGKEVDFILEWGNRLFAFEVKLTQNPSYRDINGLLSFMEDYPETIMGILIYTGDTLRYLHSRIIAIPWWWIV